MKPLSLHNQTSRQIQTLRHELSFAIMNAKLPKCDISSHACTPARWEYIGQAKVALKCTSEDEMFALAQKAEEQGIVNYIVVRLEYLTCPEVLPAYPYLRSLLHRRNTK
jgi:hypothetical protein